MVTAGKPHHNLFLLRSVKLYLVINGEDHDDVPDGLSVLGLIKHLELPEKKIAVERNLEIVPKSTFSEAMLADGDKLEIIHFIGGG